MKAVRVLLFSTYLWTKGLIKHTMLPRLQIGSVMSASDRMFLVLAHWVQNPPKSNMLRISVIQKYASMETSALANVKPLEWMQWTTFSVELNRVYIMSGFCWEIILYLSCSTPLSDKYRLLQIFWSDLPFEDTFLSQLPSSQRSCYRSWARHQCLTKIQIMKKELVLTVRQN